MDEDAPFQFLKHKWSFTSTSLFEALAHTEQNLLRTPKNNNFRVLLPIMTAYRENVISYSILLLYYREKKRKR